jgi:transposase, IS30 family
MPKRHQTYLTYTQRCQISEFLARKMSISQIALALDKHKSTIYREIKRGIKSDGKITLYNARYAMQKYKKQRENSKKLYKYTEKIKEYVIENLEKGLSPEQISGRLSIDNPDLSISHETIYKEIWADKKAGGTLYKYLRRGGRKYQKRGSLYKDRGILGRIDIDERPDIAEKKERLGDWEGDLVLGSKESKVALVTMVDRASKLTKIGRVQSKEAFGVRNEIVKMMGAVKDFVETITFDNGREFVHHEGIGGELGAKVYFTKPYHSWERGLNEHTNGLIRQYFSKGTSLEHVTQEEIEKVENLLNNRPRKVLGYRTPSEVFFGNYPTHHLVASHT